MGKRMTFAAAGDSFITRRQPGSNKAFTDIASLIRRAEVRFTNLEVTVHDYEGYPSAVSGGTWAIASPNVLQDLAEYGFNILSTANNHALDYSQGLPWGIDTFHFYAKYGLGAQHNVADALDVRTDCDTKGLGVNPEVWESVIPRWKYRGDKLEELVLYPISLGYGLPRYERGWPELSSNFGTLERLAEKSRLFGTEIEIDDRACTGRVRLLSNFSKEAL